MSKIKFVYSYNFRWYYYNTILKMSLLKRRGLVYGYFLKYIYQNSFLSVNIEYTLKIFVFYFWEIVYSTKDFYRRALAKPTWSIEINCNIFYVHKFYKYARYVFTLCANQLRYIHSWCKHI